MQQTFIGLAFIVLSFITLLKIQQGNFNKFLKVALVIAALKCTVWGAH